ncbi:4-(cytidine 5'-diphospho)-2-C-methyl-D-erythritol kinase [Litorivita pollutaquae]|uniref:4-diphosphocytidyl-2-C-methyl-D-erythritol kinase n=1 Tax=Litorivita pollutaquae TaxID=2200892 RepID=A0A2V4MUA2_9RHOB|nr:4-(cytidine 5'-diphospho)-2-C-methyl-D-erythritol kinase [Litorivita pollutaquae]PYC47808.1 4-(cytidine 5'-diphospho)-2-C-methyl-D-erythritol kinase [Litorivita pollutaquae]
MTTIEVFAPAKVNLTLHITGQRADGYHLLDSLVGFAGVGDVLRITPDGAGDFTVTGPEAGDVPIGGANFVSDVADVFWTGAPLSFSLEKNLPVAAGIGGGSADAAACFRGLEYLNGDDTAPSAQAMAQLLAIGADVPMCAASDTARVQGIGEAITPLDVWPELPILLVNPRVAVPTGPVFKALTKKDNPPMEALPADMADLPAVFDWLARQRNDLEPPAQAIAPQIARVLDAIAQTSGCRAARMSGSGATCFGLYESDAMAAAAAAHLRAEHPHWWVQATRLNGARRAAPQLIRATT